MPRVLGGSWGVGRFFMGEVPLYTCQGPLGVQHGTPTVLDLPQLSFHGGSFPSPGETEERQRLPSPGETGERQRLLFPGEPVETETVQPGRSRQWRRFLTREVTLQRPLFNNTDTPAVLAFRGQAASERQPSKGGPSFSVQVAVKAQSSRAMGKRC